ncbi:MAG: hypothetical protein A3G47_02260 [Candidatus Zambryskibacteria bacterium RIFCSPLOWO2_12_FULL_39_45]|uniref:Uncharacterized protein n=2 Tax=Candidatus Zambryskiibacteriota TaxID=1817925 RepID=A0A1G2T7L1_9BACT|nr:MAG: hypothetical protein UT81_C0016G0011 [Parcubacteria group bacterium GW2011_GWA2_40_14]OHA93018.1 MAG: hypothetical protein A2W58_02000 [Candidatus Zambryskibacteria bacterium RIFCSPHIGHO2_02_38_10.5]OHB07677.1 MAG: hypothetical protein A2W64_00240 [Candidatus Zambryskibacteria bacterium RIFCSPLOWO2_02_39_10]OHB13117.1 MAG: hypothetical protein A3G47_02260 [Candidatus Zambryskibacteria bacterium RIFCSPLOWO2_12_FULL_39_45]OHB13390.1 MAG: hypothetical protein A2Y49_01820 [Candidatus Zambry
MRKKIFLPSGREHELLLGLTAYDNGRLPDIPYASLRKGVLEVMDSELYIPAEEEGEDVVYDPSNPTWGGSDILFVAVKSYLPRRPRKSLELYPAIKTSLDIHHGVDYFFVWMNLYYVTLDLSLRQKEKKSSVDIITNLGEVTPDDLGQKIALLLIEKRGRGECLIKPKTKRRQKKEEKLEI